MAKTHDDEWGDFAQFQHLSLEEAALKWNIKTSYDVDTNSLNGRWDGEEFVSSKAPQEVKSKSVGRGVPDDGWKIEKHVRVSGVEDEQLVFQERDKGEDKKEEDDDDDYFGDFVQAPSKKATTREDSLYVRRKDEDHEQYLQYVRKSRLLDDQGRLSMRELLKLDFMSIQAESEIQQAVDEIVDHVRMCHHNFMHQQVDAADSELSGNNQATSSPEATKQRDKILEVWKMLDLFVNAESNPSSLIRLSKLSERSSRPVNDILIQAFENFCKLQGSESTQHGGQEKEKSASDQFMFSKIEPPKIELDCAQIEHNLARDAADRLEAFRKTYKATSKTSFFSSFTSASSGSGVDKTFRTVVVPGIPRLSPEETAALARAAVIAAEAEKTLKSANDASLESGAKNARHSSGGGAGAMGGLQHKVSLSGKDGSNELLYSDEEGDDLYLEQIQASHQVSGRHEDADEPSLIGSYGPGIGAGGSQHPVGILRVVHKDSGSRSKNIASLTTEPPRYLPKAPSGSDPPADSSAFPGGRAGKKSKSKLTIDAIKRRLGVNQQQRDDSNVDDSSPDTQPMTPTAPHQRSLSHGSNSATAVKPIRAPKTPRFVRKK